jgi:hypothetical protein
MAREQWFDDGDTVSVPDSPASLYRSFAVNTRFSLYYRRRCSLALHNDAHAVVAQSVSLGIV